MILFKNLTEFEISIAGILIQGPLKIEGNGELAVDELNLNPKWHRSAENVKGWLKCQNLSDEEAEKYRKANEKAAAAAAEKPAEKPKKAESKPAKEDTAGKSEGSKKEPAEK